MGFERTPHDKVGDPDLDYLTSTMLRAQEAGYEHNIEVTNEFVGGVIEGMKNAYGAYATAESFARLSLPPVETENELEREQNVEEN